MSSFLCPGAPRWAHEHWARHDFNFRTDLHGLIHSSLLIRYYLQASIYTTPFLHAMVLRMGVRTFIQISIAHTVLNPMWSIDNPTARARSLYPVRILYKQHSIQRTNGTHASKLALLLPIHAYTRTHDGTLNPHEQPVYRMYHSCWTWRGWRVGIFKAAKSAWVYRGGLGYVVVGAQ